MPDTTQQLLDYALKAGATHATVLQENDKSLSVAHRLGKLEKLEHAESVDVGLRVIIDGRSATVSGSDTRDEALKLLAEQAVELAKASPVDEYALLATENLCHSPTPLDIDDYQPTTDELLKLCTETEEAALAVKGVTNSEGAEANHGISETILCTSNGFHQSFKQSSSSLSASVLAGTGENMERDYDYSAVTHFKNLTDAKALGQSTGEKAVKRLNPQAVKTGKFPVIYDPRVASGLLRAFASAINGRSIIRGTSFLKDSLNDAVFGQHINIIDDPHRAQGLRSRPFDGEGVTGTSLNLIENGVLKHWLLDTATAAQLNKTSNGRAAFNLGGAPSPSASNLYLENGKQSVDALLTDIKEGFFVTEAMGMGVNGLTGDYSQGAAGFWIENGKIAYPVNNATIASTLQAMFKSLIPANDLKFKTGIDSPTLLIPEMTVAG